ncbi:MAG: ABC transporter substrate-binding protein [Bacillota bacterium]
MSSFKRFLSIILTIALVALLMAGCGKSTTSTTDTKTSDGTAKTESTAKTETQKGAAEKPYIAIISKGFQHQFWQTVLKGAQDAAAKYNVDMTFDGPPSESDVNIQVDMLNAAIAKNPEAIALAALDTESVTSQLNDCKAKGIPVIGFDSGVPNAPEGTIYATASTNNESAGALAADKMFEALKDKIAAATTDNKVVIACQSQDATSASIVGRTVGFVTQMAKLAEELHPGKVAITGHEKWAKPASSGSAAVEIFVIVPPSSSATDAQNASQTILNMKGVIGLFCSNEASVNGILAATTDGKELDKANGKYKDLVVIGFDAGKAQKAAVKNGWFYGSITQDPYMIGYLSVELAVKAINGEKVADSDTGCKFYDKSNMDQPDIAQLLYD